MQSPTVERLEGRPGVSRFTPVSGKCIGVGLSEHVLSLARSLGFAAVGLTGPQPLSRDGSAFKRWLAQSFGAEMKYLSAPVRDDPRLVLPEAKSILVAALAYEVPTESAAPVASYALGQDYHHIVKAKLLSVAQGCADAAGKPIIARACVDSAPLLERALAARAGVGFQGKSTLTIIPSVGTRVVLGELLMNIELPVHAAATGSCGQCSKCLDACPTGAFVAPYQLDARRCISYLTIELQGSIPRELRAPIGGRIFGCDICQQVCPYNQSRKLPPSAPELAAKGEAQWPSFEELVNIGSAAYRRLVAGSSLRRISRPRLQRNAAVALGNTGQASSVAALSAALRNSTSALVREHAAWALGRIGGPAAIDALVEARKQESDAVVQSELALCLKEQA